MPLITLNSNMTINKLSESILKGHGIIASCRGILGAFTRHCNGITAIGIPTARKRRTKGLIGQNI